MQRPLLRSFSLAAGLAIINVGLVAAAQLAWAPWREAGAAAKPGQAAPVSEEEKIIDLVAKASPAVVSILVEQKGASRMTVRFDADGGITRETQEGDYVEVGRGTGFLVRPDGLIVTNRHVAGDRDARYTVILLDERRFDAKIIDIDPINDLALLKIDGGRFPALALEAADRVRIGQTVVAIGNALGKYANTVTRGILSGLGRDIEASNRVTGGLERLEDILQTDAAINEGNSGGPLLNLDGKVIGVNTAVETSAQGLGFAIPVAEVRKVLASYDRYGAIARPRLGVRYLTITPELVVERGLTQTYGALIDAGEEGLPAIIPNAPAAAAGLRAGDIIIKVGGRKLEGKLNLGRALRAYDVGDAVAVTFLRDGVENVVTVRLDAHPPFDGR